MERALTQEMLASPYSIRDQGPHGPSTRHRRSCFLVAQLVYLFFPCPGFDLTDYGIDYWLLRVLEYQLQRLERWLSRHWHEHAVSSDGFVRSSIHLSGSQPLS